MRAGSRRHLYDTSTRACRVMSLFAIQCLPACLALGAAGLLTVCRRLWDWPQMFMQLGSERAADKKGLRFGVVVSPALLVGSNPRHGLTDRTLGVRIHLVAVLPHPLHELVHLRSLGCGQHELAIVLAIGIVVGTESSEVVRLCSSASRACPERSAPAFGPPATLSESRFLQCRGSHTKCQRELIPSASRRALVQADVQVCIAEECLARPARLDFATSAPLEGVKTHLAEVSSSNKLAEGFGAVRELDQLPHSHQRERGPCQSDCVTGSSILVPDDEGDFRGPAWVRTWVSSDREHIVAELLVIFTPATSADAAPAAAAAAAAPLKWPAGRRLRLVVVIRWLVSRCSELELDGLALRERAHCLA